MTEMQTHCAVIGGGVTGLAAAYALAKRGASVTLFEQFNLGHDRGSSHGATRLFRTAYFEHADYVPLLRRAAALWRNLESECATPLLNMCGVLMAGGAEAELIAGTLRAASDHNLPIDHLTHAQSRIRFPWLAVDHNMEIFIEPEAGFLDAQFACAAFLHCVHERGVTILQNAHILSWRKAGAQIELDTKSGKHLFDRVIIAPGAYASTLLGPIGQLVRPMQKNLFWTSPGDARFRLSGGMLPFGVEESDGRFFMAFRQSMMTASKLANTRAGLF